MVSQAPSTTSAPLATASAASTSKTQRTSEPRPLCRYAGKRCYNPRVTKRNGSLHNLCHEHRMRANQNQRRMELKRRLSRCREDNDARVEINASRVGLYPSYYPIGASSPLGMVDIDAHLGWIPPSPHGAMPPHEQYYQYQQSQLYPTHATQPDFALSALVSSIALDNDSYAFTDLSTESTFAKDALCAQALPTSSLPELDALDSPSSVSMPLDAQSDMWIVPNFLLSL